MLGAKGTDWVGTLYLTHRPLCGGLTLQALPGNKVWVGVVHFKGSVRVLGTL